MSFRPCLAQDFSALVRSEFQTNLQFSRLYDVPKSNVEDCFALKLLDIKVPGFDFAARSSSPDVLWRFDWKKNGCKKTSRNSTCWNKRRRWFHSSRVTLPLLNMYANWPSVSTYLIGIRWGPHRFCQTTCLTQLCGFWTRVSSASKEITSVSVDLWSTDVCFLHIQLIGTNVRRPKIHEILTRLI